MASGWTCTIRRWVFLAALGLLPGCPEDGLNPLTGGGDENPAPLVPSTPSSTPTVTPTAGGTTARCAVSQQNIPGAVPLQAVSSPQEKYAQYGDSLNGFWSLGVCLFDCDPGWYPTVQHNAISFYPPPCVIYDPNLFAEWLNSWGSDVPALTFLAHEWGHQVQYARGLAFNYVVEAELDADTRAGYYVGAIAQQSGQTSFSELAQFLQQFGCSLGDPAYIPWYNQNAHGSCQQRADAMLQGFNQAVSTSTVGRAGRANPSAPTGVAGTWAGELAVSVSVLNEDGVQGRQVASTAYQVTIAADGRVTDNNGTGPLPDVGGVQSTPVQTDDLDFVVDAEVTGFSCDDEASRYEWDLAVLGGTAGGVPVTGTGFETDVLTRRPDGTLNVYMYMSLTLTGATTGRSARLIIETSAILNRQ